MGFALQADTSLLPDLPDGQRVVSAVLLDHKKDERLFLFVGDKADTFWGALKQNRDFEKISKPETVANLVIASYRRVQTVEPGPVEKLLGYIGSYPAVNWTQSVQILSGINAKENPQSLEDLGNAILKELRGTVAEEKMSKTLLDAMASGVYSDLGLMLKGLPEPKRLKAHHLAVLYIAYLGFTGDARAQQASGFDGRRLPAGLEAIQAVRFFQNARSRGLYPGRGGKK